MNRYSNILSFILKLSKLIWKTIRKDGPDVVSLLTTPLLIFISTSIPIYLSNQADLGYQLDVFMPFLWFSIGTVLVGLVLWIFSDSRFGRVFLWGYYLAGPLFLIFTFFREDSLSLLEYAFGISIFIIFSLVLIITIAYFKAPCHAVSYFAILSFLLLVFEFYHIGTGIKWHQHSFLEERSVSTSKTESGQESLPNIYHIILDGFQSDIFTYILTPEIREDLNEFAYFPEATALYSETTWSVPSVFLGETYTFSNSQQEYQNRAFNSDASVLYALKEAGYSTSAYTRNLYPIKLKLFDYVIEHVDNIGTKRADNSDAFISAWIYRYAPLALKDILINKNIFISEDSIEQFNAGTFLPASAPEESFLSFQRFLTQEKELADSGRYTFIHLMLPHSPYVLDANCATNEKEATVLTQSRCATKLIVDFINELKALGRYENSLIIIHGDHGDRYAAVLDDKLVSREPPTRSPRSLLLLKTGSSLNNSEMEVSSFRASLLDIVPTLISSIGSSAPRDYEGVSLAEKDFAASEDRSRYYFVVGNQNMKKYLIDGNNEVFKEGFVIDKMSTIPDSTEEVIPTFKTNEVIEAEAGHLSSSHVGSDIPGTHRDYVRTGGESLRYKIRVEADGSNIG